MRSGFEISAIFLATISNSILCAAAEAFADLARKQVGYLKRAQVTFQVLEY